MSISRRAALTALVFALPAAAQFHIYAGSTHAHTSNTWSHGDQFAKNNCAGIQVFANNAWSDGYVKSTTGCSAIYVIDSLQYPTPNVTVKPDAAKFQGPPSEHFAQAKAAGYDFYSVTDHSQEAGLQAFNSAGWLATRQAAARASDANFAALAGFEFSENDGPGGVGHINVFNTAEMLNALAPGVDLPHFYNWLKTAQPNIKAPIVASFNHAEAHQYKDWADRDPQVTDIITMLEVINSNNKIHYPAYINALDKGWKVSPVCGNDNHGLGGIKRQTSRTFVLATAKDPASILDAMKNRRTYASLAKNLHCTYTANGKIMGSTLAGPAAIQFEITAEDPTDNIVKLDIVTDAGAVVQTYTPTPAASIKWSPLVDGSKNKYFFVRVWNTTGGNAPGADPANPVAWLAPVWTGR